MNAHSRAPSGRRLGSSSRSIFETSSSLTCSLISVSSSAVSQSIDWLAPDASRHSGASVARRSLARTKRSTSRSTSTRVRVRSARTDSVEPSPSSQVIPRCVACHGRCRPVPPSASPTKPCSASLRRCHEQLAGLSPSRLPSSLAVIGPSTMSASRMLIRSGCAMARSSRGSVRRRGWEGMRRKYSFERVLAIPFFPAFLDVFLEDPLRHVGARRRRSSGTFPTAPTPLSGGDFVRSLANPYVATAGTASIAAMAALAALLALAPSAQASKAGSDGSTGTASVFMVNPVQSSGDESLTDSKDADSAVPASAYATVQLRNLDGSGYLSGKWANVRTNTGPAAYSTSNQFLFTRHDDRFEQVMAYFWVNQAQEYLQSLGFGSSLRPVNMHAQDVRIDQYGIDNSYQTDKQDFLRFGKGGVDDAEDAEVIVHEYGHAVHASQVPGFGTSLDAGSIGEAWGDYFAVSVGLDAAKQYGWPVKAEEACPMDWDSTSYTGAPHCIRRFDLGLTVATRQGEVHADGQIWSQALWEIRQGYVAMGRTTATWDRTLVQSQFSYAADTSFSAAAKATYTTALANDGAKAAALVKDRF